MSLTNTSTLLRVAIVIACALPTPVLAITSTVYRVTDLGVLPGSDSSAAMGINDLGEVTGGSGQSAFYWSPHTGMMDLGIPAAYNRAVGVAINNSGQIAVRTSKGSPPPFQGHAFRWTAGIYEDLGTLGGTYSAPHGIDDIGRIAGFAYTPTDIHAFRSTTGTSMVDIDGLGGDYSLGLGMNASGHVVGEAITAAGQTRAFLWPGAGPMQDLGTLPGGTQSHANDISDNGLIVGVSSLGPEGPVHAFLYDHGAMNDLGSPTPFTSRGTAVNNAAQVIGEYATAEGFGRPFLWDAAGGIRDLNTVLDPISGAGWILLNAQDLNNAGQIVGQGFHNSDLRAYLLTPVPEPTPALLLAIGAAISVLKRRPDHESGEPHVAGSP